MQASNICTPIGGDIGTIFVAIELSRRSWLVTVHSPDRDRFSRHNVLGGDQEDMRRDSRERQRLVQEQTAHINRIKALLRLLGMAVGNPRRRDWLSWLEAQRDWQGEPVPPRQMTELEREHARLMLVREQ